MSTENNDLELATGQRATQSFSTLAAQYALLGYVLIKGESPAGGAAQYYATQLGTVQPLADLDTVAQCLGELVGRGDGGG